MPTPTSKLKNSESVELAVRVVNATLTGVSAPRMETVAAVVPAKESQDSDSLDHVRTVLGLAKAGLTGIGIPGVEAITAVPLEIIAMIETMKTNQDNLKVLLRRINSLEDAVLAPIRAARERDGFRVPDELRARLETLIKEFQKSQRNIHLFKDLPGWQRLRRRSQIATALKDGADIVADAIAVFQAGGQVTVELLLRDVHNQVQEIGNRVKEFHVDFQSHRAAAQGHDDDAVMSKLQPVHGGLDVSEKSGCLENTREELLSDIYRDLSRPELAFVCLYGSPGTGKSAVAKSVAAALRARGILGASYFFDKSGSDKRSISLSTLISTLCYELALVNHEFQAAVVDQLKSGPSPSSANKDTRLQKLLLAPLCLVSPPLQPLVIVLDALDECGGPDAQEELAELLRCCCESIEFRSRITFFLTSRPEPAITDILNHQELIVISASHQMNKLSDEQNNADVLLFVQAGFRKLIGQIKVPSTMPRPSEVARFAALSAGLFEIAAVLLRQLQKFCVHSVASLTDGIAWIHGLASTSSPNLQLTLPAVYASILETAYDELFKIYPRHKVLADYRNIVGALASLQRPLSTTTLSALIELKTDVIVRLLRPLSSVIDVPDGGTISFFHASFLDFILSDPESLGNKATSLSPYLVSSVRSHIILAKRSLVIMNESLCRNMLDLVDPSVYNKEITELPKAMSQRAPLHLRYALCHWAEHLRAEGGSECHNDVVLWCNKSMMFYIEALSLLGELKRAVPLLYTAEDWARKVGDRGPAVVLLYDCRRLVQMFFPVISQSAGSIYTSALPFIPPCDLRERYSHLADGGPIVIKGLLSTWPALQWAAEHPQRVHAVSFSPDGLRIASGCSNGLLCVLSPVTGRIEQLLKGHIGGVLAVAFSPDGTRIVSGSDDRTLRIWAVDSGEQERVLEGHTGLVNSVALSPDAARIVSGSNDSTVRIWSAASGEQEQVLERHTSYVNSVAFSPDGARIVSGSEDCTVRIWSVASGEQERVLEGHTGLVNSVALSPDAARIVSGSNDCTVRIWSAASGEQEQVLEGHTRTAVSVAFSPDGTRIVSGSNDCTVRIWSAASGEQEQVLEGHTDCLNSVAFSQDGRAIKSTDNRGRTLFWDAETGGGLDQDHPLAQLAIPEEDSKDGWLRTNGLSVWVPRYIQGNWWSVRDMVIMDSDDTPGRLAFIRLPSAAGSNHT